MSKLLRYLFRLFVRLLLFLIGAMAVGCLVPQSCTQPSRCDSRMTVYFVNHGYHTGVAVPVVSPVHDWRRELPATAGNTLVEFGWGDREFYMSRGFPIGAAILALFWPTPAVMHVVAHADSASPILARAEVRPVEICPDRYRDMVEYIRASFRRDSSGSPVYLDEGFYSNRSGFYDAHGTYYCFNNCNTWIGGAFRAAGLATPLFDGIPQSIRWHLPDTAAPAQQVRP